MICMSNYSDQPGKLTQRLVLLLVLFVVPMAASAELYKYLNEDGVTVLNNYVPPGIVQHGYTILSEDGRVLEVVPRALTAEEIRQRESELAVSQRLAQKQRDQKEADQNLLILYSTPEDVERARDSKLASIEGYIETQKDHLRRMLGQKHQYEASLANIERAGGTVGADSLDRIRVIEGRMAIINSELAGKRSELDILRVNYAADLNRVRELLGSGSIN
jgi:hypothetical protein